MPLYRKKPLTVEAVCWQKHGDHPEVRQYGQSIMEQYPIYEKCGFIETREGSLNVRPGTWILGPGAGGEFWPVQPEIFEATYEKVEL